MDVDSRHTVCPDYGGDHAAVFEDVAERPLADEDLRPWRRGLGAGSRQHHREDQEWLELRSLD